MSPEMLSKTRIKSESPTKTMTWIVIFTIIIFIGLLAGVLFFTWHRQSRLAREELLAARKSAFPGGSEKEIAKIKGPSKGVVFSAGSNFIKPHEAALRGRGKQCCCAG